MNRDEIAAELERRIGRIAVERHRQHTFGGFVPLPEERSIELGIYERAYLWAHKLLTNRNTFDEQVSKAFLVNGAHGVVRQYETAISWGNAEADKQNAQHIAAYKEIVPLFESLVESEDA
ncbi:hypothetical protein [Nonomuraea sp. NPDC049141]|uniref:hypothetical protein n=1 Tax=Nonomuraea sp. NPDC049141 TaxID=3155500 RepID=UPI0033EF0E23